MNGASKPSKNRVNVIRLFLWLTLFPAALFSLAAGLFSSTLFLTHSLRGQGLESLFGVLAPMNMFLPAASIAVCLAVCLKHTRRYRDGELPGRQLAWSLLPHLLLSAMVYSWMVYSSGMGMLIYNQAEHNPARGELSRLRGKLQLYRRKEGRYPAALSALEQDSRYPFRVPALWRHSVGTPHRMSSGTAVYPTKVGRDSGLWGYVNEPSDPYWGTVYIDCTHTDLTGKTWSSY